LSSCGAACDRVVIFACKCTLVLHLLVYFPPAQADQYVTREHFVRRNILDGSVLVERKVVLTAEEKQRIKRRWLLAWLPDSMDFIVGQDKDGNITGTVSFAVVYGEIHREYHHVGVGIAPSGKITEVAVMEAKSERPGRLATKVFLEQFKGKGSGRLSLARDIDAVTGATESSKTVVDAVNAIVAVYSESFKE